MITTDTRTTAATKPAMAPSMAPFGLDEQPAPDRASAPAAPPPEPFGAAVQPAPAGERQAPTDIMQANAAPVPAQPADAGQAERARASAFARAKDAAGQLARSSIDALHNTMADRGIGGGLVARDEAGAIGQSGQHLADYNTRQYQSDLASAAGDADLRFQGQQQQQAQNSALAQSLLALLNGRLY